MEPVTSTALIMTAQALGSGIEGWLNQKEARRQERMARLESEKNRDLQRLGLATNQANAKAQERRKDAEQNRIRRLFAQAMTNQIAIMGQPRPNFRPMTPLPSGVASAADVQGAQNAIRRIA